MLAVRRALETMLELWQGFSASHLFPIAVLLGVSAADKEEVMCASDLDLGVGLLYTLAGDLLACGDGEDGRGLSAVALKGLAQLVKHSASATSRRFGGKALYLLSPTTHAKDKAMVCRQRHSCVFDCSVNS